MKKIVIALLLIILSSNIICAEDDLWLGDLLDGLSTQTDTGSSQNNTKNNVWLDWNSTSLDNAEIPANNEDNSDEENDMPSIWLDWKSTSSVSYTHLTLPTIA
jgi:hypothetical protein